MVGLAHLIATSKTGAFAHAILGADLRRDAFAKVKIGDQDLEKTIDTGEAMRAWARPVPVRDVLLLPRADRLLWNDVLKRADTAQSKRAQLAHAISVIFTRVLAEQIRDVTELRQRFGELAVWAGERAGGRIGLQMRWLHDPAKLGLQVAA